MSFSPLLTFVQDACNYNPADDLIPFVAEGTLVGWIAPEFARHLENWPDIFAVRPRGVTLQSDLGDADQRSTAVAEVIEALAMAGIIQGWRDEQVSVGDSFYAEPLLHMERAASRYFGIMVFASHCTGHTVADGMPMIWLARRAKTKNIDPGKLDNLVGGRISRSMSATETLYKEAWEEAGIPRETARAARAAGALRVCRKIPEGVHRETIFVHDLYLSPEYRPTNQDGEVERFYCVTPNDALARVEQMTTGGDFTVEAAIVMLNFLVRRGFYSTERADYVDLLRAMTP